MGTCGNEEEINIGPPSIVAHPFLKGALKDYISKFKDPTSNANGNNLFEKTSGSLNLGST